MILDIHAHLYCPDWYPDSVNRYLIEDFIRRSADKKTGGSAESGARSVCRMMSDPTGATTLRIMDKVGIQHRVILILDWGVELGEGAVSIRQVHETVLGICRGSGGRLLGFAGVDPRREEAVALVSQAFDEWGAVGLKLHPTGGWTLEDPRLHEVVALAVLRGRPILVHVGKTMRILSDRNATPEALVRLARAFPAGLFIAGHSGFSLYEWFADRLDIPPNILFDISGWQELVLGRAEVLDRMLLRMMSVFPDRVCFGTDSPFYTYNLVPAEAQWLRMVQEWMNRCPETVRGPAAGFFRGPLVARRALGLD